jgi:cytochrome c biogenesis protein
MPKPSKGRNNPVWQTLASVRLSVVTLCLLAAASIAGTFIPQGNPPEFYLYKYPLAGKLITALDIHILYSSWWFRLLLLLLCANITVCSIDRLSRSWRIIFPGRKGVNPERIRKAKDSITFDSDTSKEEMIKAAEILLATGKGRADSRQAGDETFVFTESGRWTRLGVYIVHASVLLLLAGGLTGSIYGFRGTMNIPEGKESSDVMLGSGKPVTLPFSVRCDDFDVSFYESGMPKEFRSKLTLIENGGEIFSKDILVNSPLRYRGLSFFQSSYGVDSASDIKIEITTRNGEKLEKVINIGDTVEIPGNQGKFTVSGFEENFHVKGHSLKEVFTCFMLSDGKPSNVFIVPAGMPGFDKMRGGDFYVNIKDYKKIWYTGLQVTKDPGVPLVYTGFILMIAGCIVSFFMAHRQFGIFVKQTASGCRVTVCGVSSRKNPVFEEIVMKMAEKLGGKNLK